MSNFDKTGSKQGCPKMGKDCGECAHKENKNKMAQRQGHECRCNEEHGSCPGHTNKTGEKCACGK